MANKIGLFIRSKAEIFWDKMALSRDEFLNDEISNKYYNNSKEFIEFITNVTTNLVALGLIKATLENDVAHGVFNAFFIIVYFVMFFGVFVYIKGGVSLFIRYLIFRFFDVRLRERFFIYTWRVISFGISVFSIPQIERSATMLASILK